MAILSDICEYGKGKTKVSELNKNTYISTENMLANKGGVVVASSIPSTKMVSKIMPGDVIVSNIRPYFKKIWYAREEGGCSNDVLIFRAKPGTDNKFLYYVLADDKFFDYVMSSVKGTKMPRGDKSAIMKYEVPEYSLNLQHKIAKFLSRIDTKIEVNEKINRNLSEQANLYYEEWKQSVIGKKIELSAVIDVRDGTHASPKAQEKGFPLVTSKHLLEYDVDLISPNKISQKDYDKVNERSKVDYHDVLMSMIGTVGLVSFVSRKKVNFAIKNVALFKTSQKQEFAYYLLMYLKSSETQKYIKACLAGSTQQYISLAELRKMPILVPNVDELVKFNAVAEPIIDLICANVKENQRLVQIRDILLPKLMSGELDVSKLDI